MRISLIVVDVTLRGNGAPHRKVHGKTPVIQVVWNGAPDSG